MDSCWGNAMSRVVLCQHFASPDVHCSWVSTCWAWLENQDLWGSQPEVIKWWTAKATEGIGWSYVVPYQLPYWRGNTARRPYRNCLALRIRREPVQKHCNDARGSVFAGWNNATFFVGTSLLERCPRLQHVFKTWSYDQHWNISSMILYIYICVPGEQGIEQISWWCYALETDHQHLRKF